MKLLVSELLNSLLVFVAVLIYLFSWTVLFIKHTVRWDYN